MQHSIGNEHLVANLSLRGPEQSFPNEHQNPTASKRVLLPLEPEFSHMLDPSVIIVPPINIWQSADRHTSLARRSRGDQPKTKHRTKKMRRHRSFSSSSSSRSSFLASQRRSKRSKRSKHSHKRRRRRSTSSSSSSSSYDYGRYKRTRQTISSGSGSSDNAATWLDYRTNTFQTFWECGATIFKGHRIRIGVGNLVLWQGCLWSIQITSTGVMS